MAPLPREACAVPARSFAPRTHAPRTHAPHTHVPRAEQRVVDTVFLLLCLLPLAVSLLLTTDGSVSTLHAFGRAFPLRTECVFLLATGYRCPVCGMTRCFAYLSHGDFAAAWRMSHAGVTVYFLCVYETAYRSLRLLRPFPRREFPAGFLRACRAAEAVLLAAAAFSVAFFFAAQFFAPRLVS